MVLLHMLPIFLHMLPMIRLYSSETKKLVLNLNEEKQISEATPEAPFKSVRQAVLHGLQELEVKYCVGAPPAGHMERELALYLDSLRK